MAPATTATRRELRILSWDDLTAELGRIEAAQAAGTLGTNGNWTPAENLDHCVKFMEWAMDGFPDEPPPPWLFRTLAKTFMKPLMLRNVRAHKPAPQGIKLPQDAAYMLPDSGVGFEQAAGRTRTIAERVARGDRFTQPSPLFGPLSHEDWSLLHLAHCSLHWSFLTLGDDAHGSG